MKITKISYGKTINIGNYQSIRVEFQADCEDIEPSEVLRRLKEDIANAERDILRENQPVKR